MTQVVPLKVMQFALVSAAAVSSANFLGTKLIGSVDPDFRFNFGALPYALVFVLLNAVSEVHGRATAMHVYRSTLPLYLTTLGIIGLYYLFPACVAEDEVAKHHEISPLTPFLWLGSACSYAVAQLFDIYLFDRVGAGMREFRSRTLTVRVVYVSLLSQLLDSFIFLAVGFGIPKVALGQSFAGAATFVVSTTITTLAAKWLVVAVLAALLTRLLVAYLRRGEVELLPRKA